MRIAWLLAFAGIIAVGSVICPKSYAEDRPRAIRIPPAKVVHPAVPTNGPYCTMLKHNGTETFYANAYLKGMRTVTYFDPATCGGTPYPFEIINLQFGLFDDGERPWPLRMQVVIYATVGGDRCNGPGTELYRCLVRCDSSIFRNPHVGTAWLETPYCVNGPFFIGVEYDDDQTPFFPSLNFDFSTPDSCDNWQYADGLWARWGDYWPPPVPGYPMFWVVGETNSLTNCFLDSSKIKINEVSTFATDFGSGAWRPAWVELYNSGSFAININGWQLVERSGASLLNLPNWSMPAKSYLRVNFSRGNDDANFFDGKGTYYTQGDSVNVFAPADEIGLYKGTITSDKIVDFVAWSSAGNYVGGMPYSHALARNIWRSSDFVNTSNYGYFSSFGLSPSGLDNNSIADWHEFDWGAYASGGYPRITNPVQTFPPDGFSLGQGSHLEWTAVNGAAQYFLEVGQDSLFGSPAVATYLADTSFSVSGLPEGRYFWRVRVQDSYRLLFERDVLSFYLAPPGGPAPDSTYLNVAQILQHKDSKLLCITNDHDFSPQCRRPGCSEISGLSGPWNNAHATTFEHIVHCEHCSHYSGRAAIAMITVYFKGSLTQDHISFAACEHIYPDDPEGDLGHQRGLWWSPSDEVGAALSWALKSASVTSVVGKPSWTDVQAEITANQHPLLICTPGQTMVLDGIRVAQSRQQIHLVDPWPSSSQPGVGFRTGWWDYSSIEIVRHYRLAPGQIDGFDEFSSIASDTDGDGVVDFDEGLGSPDYPIERPRLFQCKFGAADSDSDQVSDLNEIKNYTFHTQTGFHPGHYNNALGFADIDSDHFRSEHDCDSDNDGVFDGGEDVNGNGNNPEAGETCQFNNASGTIKLAVNKNVYSVGEVVYVVDWDGLRETHGFHANAKVNAENGDACPTKPDGSALVHNSSFWVDADGHALTSPVDTCPAVGIFHLCADVLDDFSYSTPDNLDPSTCWSCVADTSHGWHFGYDFPYYHPGQPWPPYTYPAVCTDQTLTKTFKTVEVPWWWRCYGWPPPTDKYWFGIGIPKDLVTRNLLRVDTLPAFVDVGSSCAGSVIRQFVTDSQVRNDLVLHAPDTNIYWYGFSIANWQIPDSIMTTRLKITVDNSYLDSLAGNAFVQIKSGDSVYGWSPTYYDQVTLVNAYVYGDANADGGVDISDAVYLIAYIFSGGPAPQPLLAGDANCDAAVDISDAVYLIAYIFSGGPAPCAGFR